MAHVAYRTIQFILDTLFFEMLSFGGTYRPIHDILSCTPQQRFNFRYTFSLQMLILCMQVAKSLGEIMTDRAEERLLEIFIHEIVSCASQEQFLSSSYTF